MHLLKGIAAFIFIIFNTLAVWVPLTWWLIKLTWTRGEALKRLRQRMDKIIWWWTGNNRRMFDALNITKPEIQWNEIDEMSADRWYIIICNHQSWTDIMLLQAYLYGQLPPLKFFTKQQLIWIPLVGLAMYVLGFPYVKRVTKEQIKANPKLRTADRDNTMQACEGFANHPTSVLNFVEGTRRTDDKASRQGGEFKHLLRPKIGGLDYVLEGMDNYLHRLIDVTIYYPDGVPTFWEFLQGKCPHVEMQVTPYTIPDRVRQAKDAERRAELAQWIKQIWLDKDARLETAKSTSGSLLPQTTQSI